VWRSVSARKPVVLVRLSRARGAEFHGLAVERELKFRDVVHYLIFDKNRAGVLPEKAPKRPWA
jgi:hypothetical protein